MLSFYGFFIILTVVLLLLSNRVVPIVAMTVVPVIGALFAGFSVDDLNQFFSSGINQVHCHRHHVYFCHSLFGAFTGWLMKSEGLRQK